MKRFVLIVLMFVILITYVLNLCGCSNNAGEDKSDEKSHAFNVHVVTDKNARISIPNPETYDGSAEIALRDCDLHGWNEKEQHEMFHADLSFAGLSEARVIDFVIGNVTSVESVLADVRYSFAKKRHQRKADKMGVQEQSAVGGCLVLLAGGRCSEDDECQYDSERYYIVVLDYVNKKHYMIETGLSDCSFYARPNMQLADLTGEGVDDIVIHSYLHKYRLGCEMYRFSEAGFKQIYNSEWTENGEIDDYFSGYLIDNYKAIVECKSIGYKKKISLLHCGYQEKDLDVSSLDVGGLYEPTDDMMQFARAYNKGALRKGDNYKGVFLPWGDIYIRPIVDPGGVKLRNTGIGYSLKLKHGIYIDNRYLIGYGYTYMKYNPESDWIEIAAAEFEEIDIYAYD